MSSVLGDVRGPRSALLCRAGAVAGAARLLHPENGRNDVVSGGAGDT